MPAADKTCGSTCPRNANFRALRSRHWSQRHLVGKSLLVERKRVRFVTDLGSANRFDLQILYQR